MIAHRRWALLLLAGALSISCVSAQKNVAEASQKGQFYQALSLAQKGQNQQALTLVSELLREHPGYAPGWKLQGMLLEEAGRAEAAAQAFRKGLELDPNDPDLLYKVGVNRLLAGDREQAIKLMEHYVRLAPEDGDGLFYLAQAYHLSGHDDRALKTMEECLRLQPKNPAVWQKYGNLLCSTGDAERGYEWLTKAQRADPHLARIEFDLGVASLSRMDFHGAASYAQQAVQRTPEDLEAEQLLASAQIKLLQWPAAAENYQRILQLHPSDPDAWMGLGRCRLEMHDYPAAVEALNRLLRLDPERILAHYYLAKAYAGMGNAAESKHEADLHHRMMEQTSFSPSALGAEEDRKAWAQARQLVAGHREEEAQRLFQEQDKKGEHPGHPYFLVGALDLYGGNTEAGLRSLRRALEIEPATRGAHTYLGIYAMQQGRNEEAEKEFNAELANDPNYQAAVAELGVVRFHQQRWQDAADQLARSRTRAPALLLVLCDAYFHLGKTTDANLTAEIAAAYIHEDQGQRDDLLQLLRQYGQMELAAKLAEPAAQ